MLCLRKEEVRKADIRGYCVFVDFTRTEKQFRVLVLVLWSLNLQLAYWLLNTIIQQHFAFSII